MYRYIFIAVITALCILTQLTERSFGQGKITYHGPQISLKEVSHDFGIVKFGEKIDNSFIFTNTGDRKLEVKVVGSSCGCTVGVLDTAENENRTEISPGRSSSIRVSYDVRAFGKFHQEVFLETNDPKNVAIRLSVTGSTPYGINLNPTNLTANITRGQNFTSNFILTGPADLKIERLMSDNSAFRAESELVNSDDEKSMWHIKVNASEEIPIGALTGKLTIFLSGSHRPPLTIPISGEVKGDLKVSPMRLFLGYVSVGEEKQNIIQVSSQKAVPFRITRISLRSKIFDSKPIAFIGESKSAHNIPVQLLPKMEGFEDAILEIETDRSGENLLQIPITAVAIK